MTKLVKLIKVGNFFSGKPYRCHKVLRFVVGEHIKKKVYELSFRMSINNEVY